MKISKIQLLLDTYHEYKGDWRKLSGTMHPIMKYLSEFIKKPKNEAISFKCFLDSLNEKSQQEIKDFIAKNEAISTQQRSLSYCLLADWIYEKETHLPIVERRVTHLRNNDAANPLFQLFEIWQNIAGYLDLAGLLRMAQVSWFFNNVISSRLSIESYRSTETKPINRMMPLSNRFFAIQYSNNIKIVTLILEKHQLKVLPLKSLQESSPAFNSWIEIPQFDLLMVVSSTWGPRRSLFSVWCLRTGKSITKNWAADDDIVMLKLVKARHLEQVAALAKTGIFLYQVNRHGFSPLRHCANFDVPRPSYAIGLIQDEQKIICVRHYEEKNYLEVMDFSANQLTVTRLIPDDAKAACLLTNMLLVSLCALNLVLKIWDFSTVPAQCIKAIGVDWLPLEPQKPCSLRRLSNESVLIHQANGPLYALNIQSVDLQYDRLDLKSHLQKSWIIDGNVALLNSAMVGASQSAFIFWRPAISGEPTAQDLAPGNYR